METRSFKSPAEFRRWLGGNHGKSDGIWLRFFKKDSGKKSITYKEALDEALCHGWIDGQARPFDAKSWLQKYTPRRLRSGWSRNNTLHVERLIAAGKMRAAGLKQIETAKADGRWKAAYDSPKNSTAPKDFLKELKRHKKAHAFFEALNKSNKYAITYRLQTAKKPETRQRRMEMILKMLKCGEKFHP